MESSRTVPIRDLKEPKWTVSRDLIRDVIQIKNEKGQIVEVGPETFELAPDIKDYIRSQFASYDRSAKKVADLMNTYSLQARSWLGSGTVSGPLGGTTHTYPDNSGYSGLQGMQQERAMAQQPLQFPNDYFKLMLGNTIPEEEPKMQIKLTLKEAQHLEKLTAEDELLREILAKIEEGADFQIVVSFRDKDD